MAMDSHSAHDEISTPSGLPYLGNVLDIQDEVPIRGLERMVDEHGPIVRLREFGSETILIGSVALLEEVSDETKFWKTPPKSLGNIRSGPRGLFASESEDEAGWQIAHRLLMPAFGPLTIQNMFDEMFDIASQLVLKLARLGPSKCFSPTSEFTKLTLDTIALCAMDYRFNSFYQDELHPFVRAMNNSLATASDSSKVGSMLKSMLPWDQTAQKAREDGQFMLEVGQELVQYRREHPTDKIDLLNAMVKGKDPKAGKMSDELISANMVSFLVAGHETTSGLLSFAFLLLLQNPESYRRVQEEVDRVVGREKLSPAHLKQLHYINAVLRETLRLHPTAPAFVRSMRSNNVDDEEWIGGGRYRIDRNDRLACLIGKIQRDPAVYQDPDSFQPERMLDESFKKLPPSAWKPFGTGVRSCIGRPFAWQEAQICMALMFQNLDFELEDPAYKLKVKQALTVKPSGLFMKSRARHDRNATEVQRSLFPETMAAPSDNGPDAATDVSANSLQLSILYGSMTGTCKSVAQRLATLIRQRGGQCSLLPLDAAVDAVSCLSKSIIVASSYDGEPPENARKFVKWLEECTDKKELPDVSYAVFGCGHSDWKSTFHRIPKLINERFKAVGATCLVQPKLVDVAGDDIMEEADDWLQKELWPALNPGQVTEGHPEQALSMTVEQSDRIHLLSPECRQATVTYAKRLSEPEAAEKRHLKIRLPDQMSYTTGDYLTVLPLQPMSRARQVCRRFGVSEDAVAAFSGEGADFLPNGRPVSLMELLRGYFELTAPATKSDLAACLEICNDANARTQLEAVIESEKRQEAEHRRSLLSILEAFPSVNISLDSFLTKLPPLKLRYYSISSSPLIDKSSCSITYSVLQYPGAEGVHTGVASEHLAALSEGDSVSVCVTSTNQHFRLPANMASTPIIMMCVGSGLAPFRAFVEERATRMAQGESMAPALLFVGCRGPTADRLYADELDAWEAQGAVEIRYAFSQASQRSDGCRYLQERLWRERELVASRWHEGAVIYTCGGRAATTALAETSVKMLHAAEGMTDEEARVWLRAQRNQRIIVESFG